MRKRKYPSVGAKASQLRPVPAAVHLTVRQSSLLLNYMNYHPQYAEQFTASIRAGNVRQMAKLLRRIGVRPRLITQRLP
ncbi:hypothetical protein [Paenibacillus xylaniclasticus]|uniref:hypothetical protein n=1 Tax=Paenibacillus xylaniclasticus TaxID=588083 RepID=UPI000FDB0F75|nr:MULTISPECIES: hypothetical protein [Paenibacillus]GFN31511.1 hypothetical protein PCURB6_17710 [Paenibacillus curdlanolyticus]